MPALQYQPQCLPKYFSIESEVRSYSRRMQSVFNKALNAEVWDESGNRHVDFLSACGSVNYGHNNPHLKSALIDYLASDGITTSLDLRTTAKRNFLRSLQEIILTPRGLNYKVQFPGPTGTNAVEAALKLARKATGRKTVVAFSGGFHGMTLGALAATSNPVARRGAGIPLPYVHRLRFNDFSQLKAFEESLKSNSSSTQYPAAFIVETLQAEGGLNVASVPWLNELEKTAKRLGSLLIVDDIQAGCGRTGHFFSFERADIKPDIVCLSKSIGGFGLPLAIVLISPEFDVWSPGEHSGTFRGNNLAFVTGAAALQYWNDQNFAAGIASRAALVTKWVKSLERKWPGQLNGKGLGLLQGIAFQSGAIAMACAARAVTNGLLVETCGADGEVLKIMPPLTIELDVLRDGLMRLKEAIDCVLGDEASTVPTDFCKSKLIKSAIVEKVLQSSPTP